ncbi:MAG: thiamine pyrophosphate-binding protein [Phycisphaerae bacterium]|nr:thiamine pyrophosphate-binding protein [Gemmatimonadaceae bacterium]
MHTDLRRTLHTDMAPPPIATPDDRGFRTGLTVAEMLLEYLKLEGVTKVFGMPGGACIYLMEALKEQRATFDLVINRHETGAAYMADGYARVTGGLGVVLTTSGPSATNALTGMMNAQAGNIPVLLITGEVPQQFFGKGYLQEGVDARLNIDAIYQNALEYSAMVTNQSNFQTIMQQALRDSRSTPCRAAHISLPNDIAGTPMQMQVGDDKSKIRFPRSTDEYRAMPGGTDSKKVAESLAELLAAVRPLIFLGNGARRALEDAARLHEFAAFAEMFSIPVMTTPDAKGIFPESHPLSLRNYGMTACSWPQLYMKGDDNAKPYDALLVIGSSLGELSTTVAASDQYSKILIPSGPFVQVDLDRTVIGRDFPITRGIVGEAADTIDLICTLAKAHTPKFPARRASIDAIKANNAPWASESARCSETAPLHPAAMMRVINECMTDGHIFIDAGNCVGWSLNNLVIDPPLRYQSALAMGPMGFGVAAVVGAKMGAPDKDCLAIVGDCAFMMHGAEVSTAAQQNVGAVWVILNDDDLGMVTQGMAELTSQFAKSDSSWNGYYNLGHPDLAKFAEGLGADAFTITREQGPAAMKEALTTALRQARERNKPQVIVAKIDTTVMPPYGWPHLPPPPPKAGDNHV